MRRSSLASFALIFAFAASPTKPALAQSYVYATGNPAFGVNIPIENGFINVTNGNLHLEVPIASHAQRGNLHLNERLVYDSRIWMIGHYSNYYWWPNNVPSSMAGWRFVNGLETGSIAANLVDSSTTGCGVQFYQYKMTYSITYTDPAGTVHPTAALQVQYTSNCPSGRNSTSITPGYALDASGYYVTDDGTGNPLIRNNDGTEVYPRQIDRFGNYWSKDANGNLIDDLNRTPVLTTTSGNTITYSVLGFNGTRSSYVVTTTPITLNTHFNQSGVTEESNYNVTAIQSIALPDGTSYSFAYDNGGYGEMTSMTLPGGGVVQFGYTNYVDSYQNSNRWLTSYVGGHGSLTFTPAVITQCSGSQLTGCVEQMKMTTASNDDTVYTLTLNNGAWNTTTDQYQGLVSAGHKLVSTTSGYNFSNSCPANVCVGADFVTKQTDVLTLSDVGYATQTAYGFTNPQLGKVTSVKQWDYYTGTPPTAPAIDTEYTYSGYDLSQVQVLDGANHQLALTTFGFNNTASVSTAPAAGHNVSLGLSGPYLASVGQWVNTGSGSTINSTFTNDDAGTQLTSTTPNGTTTYGHDSTDTFTTSVTPPTPSSGVSLPYSATYDPSTGLLLTQTDPNGAQTSYATYDWNGRPTLINYADGGHTNASYTATQTGVLRYMTSSTSTNTQTLFDGYGRKSRVAIANGQATNPYYQTDTCYDSSGRLQFQSYQYQGTGWGTAKVCSGSAGDTYAYDGLNRVKQLTHGSGFAVTNTYQGRATLTKDEAGAQRITQVDALGRPTTVCEISSNNSMPDGSGNSASCQTDYAGTGFLTNYTYTLSTHTTTVAQGPQTRTFQTDSLGRTVLTKEPESGQTTYTYAYNTTGLSVVRTRPKANQVAPSAATTTTTTQYDSLGRVVNINYSDATPSSVFIYDATCCWPHGSVTTNLKGRLAVMGRGANTNETGGLFSYDIMGRILDYWQCAPSTCASSTADISRPIYFAYDWLGNATAEEDLASGGIVYTYSPALEVTSITNASYTTAQDVPNLISNVVNGPNGPISWSYGNGLTGVAMFDVPNQAIRVGGWVCRGSTQTYCTGGTQLYGWVADTGSQAIPTTYDTVNGHYVYGYDEFNRLTSANINSGQTAYSFTYDRWGNRTAQTLTAGTSGWHWTGSFNNLTNQAVGYSYDIAGNLLNDGSHSYTYDAEGNVLTVDAGSTATYVYDAMNRRISAQTASGTNEFVYDPAGHRMSTWNTVTNSGTDGRIYWGNQQIAYRSGDGTTYLDHQDWQGTERLRTNYQGNTAATYANLVFGDGTTQTATGSGVNQDNNSYTSLELDSLSGTYHAQFRQYQPGEGRWMSPDPYSGSYDFTNPQSLNRYTYVQNNPAWFTDPSGLDGDGGISILRIGITAAADAILADLLGVFDGPSFHGSLKPRPSASGWDGNFGESLGIPTSVPQGNFGLSIALGLPSEACEFGACNLEPGDTGGPSDFGGFAADVLQGLSRVVFPAYGNPFDVHQKLFGTHHCGPGGGGSTVNGLDSACAAHDSCYAVHGVTNWTDNFLSNIPSAEKQALQQCNQSLCNATRGSADLGATSVYWYFSTFGNYTCH